MKKFKGTKGNFTDGKQGWKVGKRETNGVKGFEIHWSDDGECVTDHVYEMEDAILIANAPEILDALQDIVKYCEENNVNIELEHAKDTIRNAIM